MKQPMRIGTGLFFLMGMLFLSSFSLFAQTSTKDSIGSDDPGRLKIIVYTGDTDYWGPDGAQWDGIHGAKRGQMQIFRGGKSQFDRAEEILTIGLKDKLSPAKYVIAMSPNNMDKHINNSLSYARSNPEAYPGYNEGNNLFGVAFDQVIDSLVINTGTEQKIIKKFRGSYTYTDSNLQSATTSFTVIWTISYNTTLPDIVKMTAEVDARTLPSSVEITLGYGFNSHVNGSLYSAAYILPNTDFNGMQDFYRARLYQDQIQNVHLVGVKNAAFPGAFFGYFQIDKPFNKGCSTHSAFTHSYMVVAQDKNLFNFGPYQILQPTSINHNLGSAVAYNIEPGKITTINTGMTFSANQTGELQYSWNSAFENLDKTIPLAVGGVDTNLFLRYKSNSDTSAIDLGFRVNLPNHVKLNGDSESLGFNSFTSTASPDSSAYSAIANIDAYPAVGNIRIPVHVSTYGRYVIDTYSISNTNNTSPLGSSATLNITSSVGYQSTAGVTISRGKSATYMVKLPDGVSANGDLTVNVTYEGDKASFSSLPATVVIPDGENSALLVISVSPSAADGAHITAILANTNHSLVTIDTRKQVTVTVTDKLVGKLSYSWDHSWPTPPDSIMEFIDGVKDVNLYLRYDNDNADAITGLKFQLNLPKGITVNDDSKHESFSSFATSATVGSVSYDVTADINANMIGKVTAPVRVSSYGQFVIDGGSFSNMVQTNPLSDPATLTVSTTVGYTTDFATVAKGKTIALTVKLPDGVVANGNLTINVDYTGDKDAFVSLPDVVVIQDGKNSASLYLTAFDSATAGNQVTAKLYNPGNPFVTVSSNNEVTVTVKDPKYLLPVNRIPAYLK
ncbi:MAG: hypothetical protein LBO74_08935 [Candidatus Symbiothrix sp.]|jgi:hypothetical protein|nr:hypothetical protein [Candidatus Symbiothrix sp.]